MIRPAMPAVVVRRHLPLRTLLALAVALSCVAVVGCTLLLPTDQLIVPCQSQADCDDNAGDGFVCEGNACLPEDDDATSG